MESCAPGAAKKTVHHFGHGQHWPQSIFYNINIFSWYKHITLPAPHFYKWGRTAKEIKSKWCHGEDSPRLLSERTSNTSTIRVHLLLKWQTWLFWNRSWIWSINSFRRFLLQRFMTILYFSDPAVIWAFALRRFAMVNRDELKLGWLQLFDPTQV